MDKNRKIVLIGKVIEIDDRFCISFKEGTYTVEFVLHDREKHLGNFTAFNTCFKAIDEILGEECHG